MSSRNLAGRGALQKYCELSLKVSAIGRMIAIAYLASTITVVYQIVTMISITYKALNVVLKSQQFNLVETDHGQHRPRITYFS